MLNAACTAFVGYQKILAAPAVEVGLYALNQLYAGRQETILCFNDETGRLLDFDFSRGKKGLIDDLMQRQLASEEQQMTESPITTRSGFEDDDEIAPRGRGRPKLGVVSKEVTLLPRHWEWLNAQPAGASATLRKLVEQARKASYSKSRQEQAVEAAYHFMHAIAGDLPHFEETSRVLFAYDLEKLKGLIQEWPVDVQHYLLYLAKAETA
jgi:hypothetical protein